MKIGTSVENDVGLGIKEVFLFKKAKFVSTVETS